jgi:hypothetical protein
MKPLICCFGLLAAVLAETELPAGEKQRAALEVPAPSAVWFTETGQQLNRLAGRGVALADVNGDGLLDAFVVNANTPDGEGSRVYFGDGRGHLTDSGQRLPSKWEGKPAIGDVNGDGKPDVAAGNTIWMNDGRGYFEGHTERIDTSGADLDGPVKLADLDGDGHLDIVAVSGWKSLRVYLGDGRGRFRDTGQQLGSAIIGSLALGDFDGDGSLDPFFACGEPATGTPNEVWLNDGKGAFRDSGLRLGNAFSWDVALGDFNGDGKPDAVVSNLRIADGSTNPPVFGGVPLEVWLNTTSRMAFDYLGQPAPGPVPVVFARGVVSTDQIEHSAPAFSPDGTEVFWTISRRPHVIMAMRREGGVWSAPAVAPFSGRHFDSGPVFSADGRRIYFWSVRPRPGEAGTGEIWFVEKAETGWGEPKRLDLATRYPEVQGAVTPTIARNGTLYFQGASGGASGLYRTELVKGEYAKPQLLPQSINQPGSLNWTPFIAPDESYLLFSSNRNVPASDGGDLYVARRLADGSWTDPVSLGEPVNSNRQERFPMLSPDGKYLFFTRPTPGHDHDVYWVDAATIPALRSMTNPRQEDPK